MNKGFGKIFKTNQFTKTEEQRIKPYKLSSLEISYPKPGCQRFPMLQKTYDFGCFYLLNVVHALNY
jgi:hypothetical protein